MRSSKGLAGVVVLALLLPQTCSSPVPGTVVAKMSETITRLRYPPTRESAQVDDYHGTRVADPYRWLEDVDGPETQVWIQQQNALSRAHLARLPSRKGMLGRLRQLFDRPRYSVPEKVGNRLFYRFNEGLQNQSSLWVEEPDQDRRLLLDPNLLRTDGTMALVEFKVSRNGRWVAYGLSEAGSDWQKWRVRDVVTGEDLRDELRWIKFAQVAWTHDHAGFFYPRYSETTKGEESLATNTTQRLYYHRLGDEQSADALVFERPDHPEWGYLPAVTENGRFLVLHVWVGTDVRNHVFIKDLTNHDSPFLPLFDALDAKYQLIGDVADSLFFVTDLDAPTGRIVAVDLGRPEAPEKREIVAPGRSTIRLARLVGQRLVVVRLTDAHDEVAFHDLEGRPLGTLGLPGIGEVDGFTGQGSDQETWYRFSSLTRPESIEHLSFESGESSRWKRKAGVFAGEAFETRVETARSRDGTAVPLFIVHRKGLPRNGSHPTLLNGYGGFAIPHCPSFSEIAAAWLDSGGVYAHAILRGGGEFGEEWHQAGMLDRKQNVFDDFIACAVHLIERGYTRSARLAIQGASNGGLLVGACLNQRPDLFAAAVPEVGVMDMLRFHKFTIGWAWTSEYGSSDDPEQLRTLLSYSPLHNIKPGARHPATLIVTGDHDDRVVPGHSFKYAAALQKAQAGEGPILLSITGKAGHGFGKPVALEIEEAADLLAFLWHYSNRSSRP